jgi:hypothetical protein
MPIRRRLEVTVTRPGLPQPEPPLWRAAADPFEPGYPYPSLAGEMVEETVETEALISTLEETDGDGGLIFKEYARLPEFSGVIVLTDEARIEVKNSGGPVEVAEDGFVTAVDPGSGLTWTYGDGRLRIINSTNLPRVAPPWLSGRLLCLAPGETGSAGPMSKKPKDKRGEEFACWLEAAGRLYQAAEAYRRVSPLRLAVLHARRGQLNRARTWAERAGVELPLPADEPDPRPGAGVPPGLLPYVAAWRQGEEPPWWWDLEWGDGFAAGPVAIAALRNAIEWHDDVRAHYHLGCALAALGDWETSQVHWAVALDGPDGAAAARNLGLAAWHVVGDKAAAAAFYRQALDMGGGPITQAEYAALSGDA